MWSRMTFLTLTLLIPQAYALNSSEANLSLMKEALALQEKEEFTTAEEFWKILIQNQIQEKNSMQEYVHFYYAKNLGLQKRNKEAREQFQKVLSLSPNIKLQQDVRYQLADLAVNEKNFRQARSLLISLEKKQRRDEVYPELVFLLGRTEMGMKNIPMACKWWRKLFIHFPAFSKISDWGPKLRENKVGDRAVGCSVDTDGIQMRLKNLQRAGLTEKTENELNILKAELNDHNKYVGDRLEASVLLQEGEVQKAVDLLLKNYEEQKNNLSFLNSLAIASARAGELPLAVGSFYRIFKLAPHSKKGKEALYQSAFLSYQFQDYDGASRRFKEFIKNFRNSGLARDAEWNLAWIRYLKGNYQGSQETFEKLLKVKSPILRDRAKYWMAMSYFRQGQLEKAREIFENLAKDKLLGFYAIAAQNRLSKISKQVLNGGFENSSDIENYSSESYESEESLADSLASSEESEESAESEALESDFDANPKLVERFTRARDLISIGLYDWAKWDLFDIEKKTRNKEYLKRLIQEYESIGSFNRICFISQTFFNFQRIQQGLEEGRFFWESAYPRAYQNHVFNYAKQLNLPTELIWGVMRQESQFKRDAVSPVGALGLMQIMPQTGLKVSQLSKENNFDPKALLEPEEAIKIGSRYLQRLMRKFENNMVLVAAAYNAGPHRVHGWLNSFGNLDLDEFVEHIPFLETRNYVKKVISNVYIYSHLYEERKNRLMYISDPIGFKLNESNSNFNSNKETWEEI